MLSVPLTNMFTKAMASACMSASGVPVIGAEWSRTSIMFTLRREDCAVPLISVVVKPIIPLSKSGKEAVTEPVTVMIWFADVMLNEGVGVGIFGLMPEI